MGCCGNSGGCKKTEAVHEDFSLGELNSFGQYVITQLLELAKTSNVPLPTFKNTAAEQLASVIASLVNEVTYLKTLLGVLRTPDIAASENTLTIKFGPNNAYSVIVPVMTENCRTLLLQNLADAIAALKKGGKPDPQQLSLQFPEALK